jgi:DNA-damage-inducible protein J
MAKKMVLVNFTVEEDIREEAALIFNAMGMNTTTALRLFLTQVIDRNALPFEVSANGARKPNAKTRKAISDARGHRNGKAYKNASDLFADLEKAAV